MGNKHIFKTNLNPVVLSLICILSVTVVLSSPPFPVAIVDFHSIITTLQHFLDCGKQNIEGREYSFRLQYICQILSKARNLQLHAEILPHLPTDMVQTAIIFAKALVLELNRL